MATEIKVTGDMLNTIVEPPSSPLLVSQIIRALYGDTQPPRVAAVFIDQDVQPRELRIWWHRANITSMVAPYEIVHVIPDSTRITQGIIDGAIEGLCAEADPPSVVIESPDNYAYTVRFRLSCAAARSDAQRLRGLLQSNGLSETNFLRDELNRMGHATFAPTALVFTGEWPDSSGALAMETDEGASSPSLEEHRFALPESQWPRKMPTGSELEDELQAAVAARLSLSHTHCDPPHMSTALESLPN